MAHSIDKASKGIWKCYIGSIPILGVSVVQVHISDLRDVAVSLYEVQILSPLIEKVKWYRISIYLWFRKLENMLIDYVRRWIDTWKTIALFLQEKMFKTFDTFEDLAERISMELKPYVERLKDVNRREHREYEFVRSLCKTYRLNLSKKVIYHRCRDRC